MFYFGLLMRVGLTAGANQLSRVVSSEEGGLRLSEQPSINWKKMACPNASSVELLDTKLQTIGGFGASMTESSAINLNALPLPKQAELLELLYGSTGAKLSAMKATMLSNDFAAQAPWSTYDDTAGDTTLSHFSIARDLMPNGSLTLIKKAIAAGFKGTIQAYMDFPPDWMLQGTLPKNATVNPIYYNTLSNYFAKYIEAYKVHGVHIDFLEAFNEPTDSYTKMSPAQLATFLGKHLGPTFEKRGLWPSTKLSYGGQCARGTAAEFIPAVLSDKDAAKYMDVIVYHGYDCQYEDDGSCNDERQNYDAIAKIAKAEPSRPLWMTEICYAYNFDDPNCTKKSTMKYCETYPRDPKLAKPLPRLDFADGATWGHRIIKELQSGTSGWIYWNLILNQTGGPFLYSPSHSDGPANLQQPVIVVDTEAKEYYTTGLFWFMAHFSRFVRPGAVRLATKERALQEGVSAVGFEATAEEYHVKVLQLVNKKQSEEKVTVCARGNVAEVTLPESSITTARW